MKKYKPRWSCVNCHRKISEKVELKSKNLICQKCINKPKLESSSLNKIPIQYFEFEKLKTENKI